MSVCNLNGAYTHANRNTEATEPRNIRNATEQQKTPLPDADPPRWPMRPPGHLKCDPCACAPARGVWPVCALSSYAGEQARKIEIYITYVTHTRTQREQTTSPQSSRQHTGHTSAQRATAPCYTHTHTHTHTHPFELFAHTPRSARSALESAAQMHMHARAAVRGKCSASVQP